MFEYIAAKKRVNIRMRTATENDGVQGLRSCLCSRVF
jgi:hypothetical protein